MCICSVNSGCMEMQVSKGPRLGDKLQRGRPRDVGREGLACCDSLVEEDGLLGGVAQGRMGDRKVLCVGSRVCCMCRMVIREILVLYALEV
jgi:hypothetical protein